MILPFWWRACRGVELTAGVFKLLKPGIAKALDEDLAVLSELGRFLDEASARYQLAALDYQATFETIRELLVHEVRLEQEQAHLAEAARLYRDADSVCIPALFPFCTPRLTAMERIQGHKVTESRRLQASSALGLHIVEALLANPLFSPTPAALFHADPHAGNLFVSPEHRLAILDWSLIGRLTREVRHELAQAMVGALTLDPGRITQAIARLALTPPEVHGVREVVKSNLRALRSQALPGACWLMGLLDQLVIDAGVRFEGNLLIFRKTWFPLEGVLADILPRDGPQPGTLLDQTLWTRSVTHWLREWPERLVAPIQGTSPRTHISEADLLQIFWFSPMILSRWWTVQSLAALRRPKKT